IPEFLVRVIPKGPIGRMAKAAVETLTDPKITSSLVVTLPETLPVTEALELAKGLEKQRMRVEGLVVNRVPLDPVSPDERAAAKGLVANGHAVLGGRELKRIERSEAALQLLRERSTQRVIEIGELELKAPQLARELAARLAAARP